MGTDFKSPRKMTDQVKKWLGQWNSEKRSSKILFVNATWFDLYLLDIFKCDISGATVYCLHY